MLKYRIIKRVYKDKSTADDYLVQYIDKHDDWFTLHYCRTFEEAEEYIKEEMREKEEQYVETELKVYYPDFPDE